jgi:large subunit ribosomal protein L3
LFRPVAGTALLFLPDAVDIGPAVRSEPSVLRRRAYFPKDMKFILGKKLHMSQIFTEEGEAVAVTVLETGPNTVTQLKSKDTDGYEAVQVGFGVRKAKNVSKPVVGHLKGAGPFVALREFRLDGPVSLGIGDSVRAGVFTVGDVVEVSAVTKGKGFQGVVKRHGFHGGPRSHGQKHSEREPGSIGGGLRSRVPRGMRMAGRTGGDRVTVKNLKIVAVNEAANRLLISGAIPGRRGTIVEVRSNA